MNPRVEGKLGFLGFQYFIEPAFEMKHHFCAAVGHRPVEVRLTVGEVVFQDPKEPDIPGEVG
ncbi:hypothetical protein D3C87_2056000 [compost metagenome]